MKIYIAFIIVILQVIFVSGQTFSVGDIVYEISETGLNLREDKKLDISLQKIGEKVDSNKVLEILKANGGVLNFTYKSDAEDIKNMFAMSKKAFKATLTKLIDEKKINLENDRICLI